MYIYVQDTRIDRVTLSPNSPASQCDRPDEYAVQCALHTASVLQSVTYRPVYVVVGLECVLFFCLTFSSFLNPVNVFFLSKKTGKFDIRDDRSRIQSVLLSIG